MNIINIQSVFIFYSAISVLCGLVLIGLFWGRKDLSALIWISNCFLSAIATAVTVYRNEIPLVISYSLMISFETAALLLSSQSLRQLLPGNKALKGIVLSLGVAVGFFIFQEILRYTGDGKLTPQMSFATSFFWVWVYLFCAYSARKVGGHFQNRLVFNFISAIFFCSSLLYGSRVLSMLLGSSYHAFDLQLINFITFFSIAVLSTLRNLSYISLRMHLSFAEHGRLNNMNLMLNNIVEERNSMISSLLRANKSSSTEALSASIAHELNQPLAASLLNVQFLRELVDSNRLTPELAIQLTDQLEKDAKRSSEIVRSLRSIFVKDGGAPEAFLVSELIDSVLTIYKSELISRGIKIKVSADRDLKLCVNKGELMQVLLNLVNNATQALQNSNQIKKEVLLSAYLQGEHCIIEVSDTGPGVPEAMQSGLFELLKGDRTGSMGVGLWLCAHVMANFGGKITYQDAMNGGAKFTLSLPLAPQTAIST
jgi:signal transduction histidine kinase